jgi:hypothetical protein
MYSWNGMGKGEKFGGEGAEGMGGLGMDMGVEKSDPKSMNIDATKREYS